MKRKILVGALALALIFLISPVPRAVADGGASTRNILMGIGAAAGTLLIINHNKQVHEHYAQDAANEAALAEQRNNAEAAYQSEVRAYNHELAVSDSYKKEVAIKDQVIANQDAVISQQKSQLAELGLQTQAVAQAPAPAQTTQKRQAAPQSTAVVAYGWGAF
jgi:hypothetical protein